MTARIVQASPAWRGQHLICLQDDETVSPRLRPAVSGIRINFDKIGQAAAEAILDEPSWPPPWAIRTIEAGPLRARTSTLRLLSNIITSLQQAADRIYPQRPRIEDLASGMGISRRSLERLCQKTESQVRCMSPCGIGCSGYKRTSKVSHRSSKRSSNRTS